MTRQNIRRENLIDEEYVWKNLQERWGKEVNCEIVGSRGVGKSAVLSAFAAYAAETPAEKLQEPAPATDGWLTWITWPINAMFSSVASSAPPAARPRPKIAFVDLKDEDSQTVAGLLAAISSQWDIAPAVNSLADLSDRVTSLHTAGVRLLLCLDGFEEMASRQQEFGVDFYLDLRGVSHQGVVIVTTNEKPLGFLLPAFYPTSSFFNSFVTLYLSPLSEKDAEDFLTLRVHANPPLTAEERRAVVAFAKGYPLRLEVAAAHVLRARENGENLETALRLAADDDALKPLSTSSVLTP